MRMAGILAGLALAACTVARAETVALPVQSATVVQDPDSAQEVVDVVLTPDGRRNLADFTRDRVGHTVHLRVDGTLLTSPTLRSPIDGGALQLSPGLTGFEGTSAREIARSLNTGSTVELSDDR